MGDLKVVTSPSPEWLLPRNAEPPRGKTLNLLLYTGVSCKGEWRDDAGFVAWAPMLKIGPEVKQELENFAAIARSFRCE